VTRRVLAIILGGGAGTRLYPLTKQRAKPAVPLAGKYRLIDIPVSNCINSEILKIYILTQFNSASLNRHIARTYNFSGFSDGFVEVLAAQQTPENPNWFQGTADAVRQYVWLLQDWDVDDYLILSGDHLYRMDYRLFVQRHQETQADITLSVVPIDERRASDFGLMKIDGSGRVVDFSEKPKGDALKEMQVDTTVLGLTAEQAKLSPYIASMGIYVFKRDALIKLLKDSPERTDFGKEIIPQSAKDYNLQAYLFGGYWEDIGTIEAFYEANLALFKHSVVGVRSRIESGCTIEDSLILGADFYQPFAERQADCEPIRIPLGIGANTTIRRAIVDKNVRIGCDVQIINKDGVQEAERESQGFYIRSGIIVILKNAVIADRTII